MARRLDEQPRATELLDGLEDFVSHLQLRRVEGASHWIVHEQPELIAGYLRAFLHPASATS